jgi:hypothetical protein
MSFSVSLSNLRSKPWTEQEEIILKENFRKMESAKLTILLPSRSQQAIQNKAQSFKIARENRQRNLN